MKKKILCLVMTILMVVGASMTAYAEDYIGSDNWTVSFTGEKMDSNFAGSDIDESILNIQPGDSIRLQVNISNDSKLTHFHPKQQAYSFHKTTRKETLYQQTIIIPENFLSNAKSQYIINQLVNI